MAGKEIGLLKEALPKVSQVALLWTPTNPAAGALVSEAERAAQAMSLNAEDRGRAEQYRRRGDQRHLRGARRMCFFWVPIQASKP